jgi:hypothetical protein
VDVVVVTEGPCSEAVVTEIVEAHEEAAVPVDATFVPRSRVALDETPTPVEFVVKPAGDQRLVRPLEGLGDFLLQRQDAYDCDAALVGPSVREVVKPVPWGALAECLDHLFPYIVPRFKNPALMLCRVAYAFAHRALCSKKTAGEWGLRVLDAGWRPLIEDALKKYVSGVPDNLGPNAPLRQFEAHCARHIATARGGT